MSVRELYEWYDYYSQEPFIADRLEIQLANIGYIASSFGGGKSKYEDFMVTGKKKKEKLDSKISKEEYNKQIIAAFRGL